MSDLAVYEHARDALAEAVRFDEVTRIHSAARQAEAYARIAKDKKLQADAAEIVARAERKLGILLRKAKGEGQLSQGGRPANSNLSEPETGDDAEPVFDNSPFTLADIGVDKKLSSRAQRAAELDDEHFETGVQAEREKILADAAPVVGPAKARATKTVDVERVVPVQPLEPRRFHQFAFSILAMSLKGETVKSEVVHFFARQAGIVAGEGDDMDFAPEASKAMGTLAEVALRAAEEPEGPREPHNYSHDERYQRAVEIVRKETEITVGLLQREMLLGFNLASRLVEWLERDGIITRVEGDAKRWTFSAVDRRLELREAYDGAVALLAAKLGTLTMAEAEPALRAGRAAEVSPLLIAQDLQHPLGTVKTWLNRLGLTSLDHMNQMNAERSAAAQSRREDSE